MNDQDQMLTSLPSIHELLPIEAMKEIGTPEEVWNDQAKYYQRTKHTLGTKKDLRRNKFGHVVDEKRSLRAQERFERTHESKNAFKKRAELNRKTAAERMLMIQEAKRIQKEEKIRKKQMEEMKLETQERDKRLERFFARCNNKYFPKSRLEMSVNFLAPKNNDKVVRSKYFCSEKVGDSSIKFD